VVWKTFFSVIILCLMVTGIFPQEIKPGLEIKKVNPSKGKVGDSIVITGSGFGDEQGSVLIGDTESTIISWNSNQIIAVISLGSSSGKLKVITPDRHGQYPFTVIPSWNIFPSPTDTFLKAVAFRSPRDGWIMEKIGEGRFFHFNGKLWEGVDKDISSNWISDICFLPSGEGWAVGGSGTILHFNKKKWDIFADALTGDDLNDVFFLSPTDGWAVGSAGRIVHYYDWTVHDISWRKDNSGIFDPLYAVEFISSEKGWAMGKDGVILEYNKKKWVKIASPAGSVIYSMDFASSNNGWAVGANGTILQYNGRAWVLYPSPVQVNLYCVYLVEDNDGWIVGEGGLIMHYNGNIWEKIDSPTTINLYDLDFRSQDDGWAVGEEGIILRYH